MGPVYNNRSKKLYRIRRFEHKNIRLIHDKQHFLTNQIGEFISTACDTSVLHVLTRDAFGHQVRHLAAGRQESCGEFVQHHYLHKQHTHTHTGNDKPGSISQTRKHFVHISKCVEPHPLPSLWPSSGSASPMCACVYLFVHVLSKVLVCELYIQDVGTVYNFHLTNRMISPTPSPFPFKNDQKP